MSSSLSKAARIAAKFSASQKNYRFDRAEVRHLLERYNAPEVVKQTQINLGGYTRATFELVPLSKIPLEKEWSGSKGPRIQSALDKGKPLPPVTLSKERGRYTINDGIHRTSVSRKNGFTHVPAIILEWIDTPEAKQVQPAKPKLREGTWVKLQEPIEGRVYGWIDEVLTSKKEDGVVRWWYNVALVNRGDDWPDYVDVWDKDFETLKSVPGWAARLKKDLSESS